MSRNPSTKTNASNAPATRRTRSYAHETPNESHSRAQALAASPPASPHRLIDDRSASGGGHASLSVSTAVTSTVAASNDADLLHHSGTNEEQDEDFDENDNDEDGELANLPLVIPLSLTLHVPSRPLIKALASSVPHPIPVQLWLDQVHLRLLSLQIWSCLWRAYSGYKPDLLKCLFPSCEQSFITSMKMLSMICSNSQTSKLSW